MAHVAVGLLLAAGALSAWLYLRRESRVRLKGLLLAVRLLVVFLLAALVWNPPLPGGASSSPAATVILDGSESMRTLSIDGRSIWEHALEVAQSHERNGAEVILAGDRARRTSTAELSGQIPAGLRSQVADAVGIAVQSGAREIVLLTDGRVADVARAAQAARGAGAELRAPPLPEGRPNLGISGFELTRGASSGDSLEGWIELQGEASGDSARVEFLAEGAILERTLLEAPPGGARRAEVRLFLEPGVAAGAVTARITSADGFELDDERIAPLDAEEVPAEIILLAAGASWESKHLLSVLERVTGLSGRGFIRTGDDRYQEFAGATAHAVDSALNGEGARAAARFARLIVVVEADEDTPEWFFSARSGGAGLLVLARNAAGAESAGLEASANSGDLAYPARSSLPLIAGAAFADLPLLEQRASSADASWTRALEVRRVGQPDLQGALFLREEETLGECSRGGPCGRTAVALAGGFWRWAVREGEARAAYRGLWSGAADWLIAGDQVDALDGVVPNPLVQPSERPTAWRAPGRAGEDVQLVVFDSLGEVKARARTRISPDGTFMGPPLPEGAYEYQASAGGEERVGRVFSSRWSGDALRPKRDLSDFFVPGGAELARFASGRALRSSPWIYLLILAALCAEWIGRRRAGLG